MRRTVRLNPGTPSTSIDLDFDAVAVVVNNPTGSPVFLRIGAPDIPTETNADLFVPSGQSMSYPVSGYAFGATFGSASAVTSTAVALSGLFQTCILTFLGQGETIPTYGSASFLTLSASELRPITAYAGVTTLPIFDIGAWGGALIALFPDAASGQATLLVDQSNTGLTGSFFRLGSYAVWPNVPSVVTVPKIARYLRIAVNTTGIVGEPAISGSISVRASLEEVQNLTYNPSGNAITKAYNIAALGSQQWQLVTAGLPAVSVAAIATAGTGAASAITFLVEASSDLVNWRQVTARDQSMSSGITLYRALGNLDLYIRVTIFEIGNNAQVGTLYVSTPSEPDLGYILNTIQQSLGDNKAPSNTNQDIFHLLQHIETWTGQASVSVASIDTKMTTVNTNLVTIQGQLSTINTNITSVNTNLTTIQGQLSTINTNITTVNTNLGTLHSDIAASNVQLTSINTAVSSLSTSQTRGAAVSQSNWALSTFAGTYTTPGAFLVPGWYISEIQVSVQTIAPSVLNGLEISVGTGTGAAVLALFYRVYIPVLPSGANPAFGNSAPFKIDSLRSPGFVIQAAHTNLWAACMSPTGGLAHLVTVSFTQVP